MTPGPPADQNKTQERSGPELARANRRLILLNEVATSLILGEASRDRLTQAFAAVARARPSDVRLLLIFTIGSTMMIPA